MTDHDRELITRALAEFRQMKGELIGMRRETRRIVRSLMSLLEDMRSLTEELVERGYAIEAELKLAVHEDDCE